jgi:hypothetical protein
MVEPPSQLFDVPSPASSGTEMSSGAPFFMILRATHASSSWDDERPANPLVAAQSAARTSERLAIASGVYRLMFMKSSMCVARGRWNTVNSDSTPQNELSFWQLSIEAKLVKTERTTDLSALSLCGQRAW